MNKKCENCGLPREEHIVDGLYEPDLNEKGCKKFIELNKDLKHKK